ncbi:hypothetical protein TVAG_459560 [Trichomonas vaginalis G3]|uniref:Baseplate structural protein Gp10 C-terminal domain-containing protein n=3 Tax=Trichomonas vaginalis (strain ATCC PRA-98 / G3) TaxID=412133 RepID=A2FHL6_TRIV3|nr:keratin-associated protein family [Trichomonas vaginalis G3]EAX95607.1 hypothetical protein TVAG_459560 [Trichomonas vaginalis G3]KAI5511930.1 keratin-associated protein family [Trichomonas vaginalis G3]|eukprot:XP_001308537.1 hypothetical protein [Trichomonas vaginalis G3]
MKSSDKTFEDIEWLCFDGVTMYLFYTGGVLYYFKTNDFKNYESFTPSVLNPDTREPIINPRIFYVEYNNGKFMGMITVGDDFCPCYSFDCIQWFKCNLNQDVKFKYPNNPIRCVNNKWVLIYEVNQIFISEDGINYYMFSMMSSDLKIDYTSKWYYINNMCFILQNDKIYRSYSIPFGRFEQIFQADGDIEALCYASNVCVLVSGSMLYSYPVSYNRHIYLSQDFSQDPEKTPNWELVYSFTPKFTRNYRFTNLFYIDGYFIAFGCGDLVNISSDGKNWSEITKFQDVKKAIFKNNMLILMTIPILTSYTISILYNKFNIHNGLNKKADKEWVNTELKKKADKEWVNTELKKKADKEWVNTELKKKADKEWVNTELNTMFEMIYPIGSIYTSMNSTNPSTLFGFGTWQQITDRFLYCTNSSKQTGGSKTITGENLPAHSHYVNLNTTEAGWHKHRYWDWSGMTKGKGYDVKDDVKFAINCYWNDTQGSGNHTHNVSGYTQTTGQSKDYMPPYMTVYAWFRTD